MIRINTGDIWKFKNGNDCFLHILKVEDEIVHIAIMDKKGRYIVEHMPFNIEIIKTNITEKVGNNKSLPNYNEGYNYWKREYDNGNAGVYTIDIANALQI